MESHSLCATSDKKVDWYGSPWRIAMVELDSSSETERGSEWRHCGSIVGQTGKDAIKEAFGEDEVFGSVLGKF